MQINPHKISILVILLLLFSGTVHAQTKNSNRDAEVKPSQSTSTQTAVTQDGRTVILNSDKTWKYSNSASKLKLSPVVLSKNCSLLFDTGVVFKSGDVKPVARSEFYLLDKSLEIILTESGFTQKEHVELDGDNIPILTAFSISYYFKNYEEKYSIDYYKAMESITPHIIATVTTDFNGKGQFTSLPVGTYYLVGFGLLYKQVELWNMEVDLKSGQNTVTLDQNNVASTFEASF